MHRRRRHLCKVVIKIFYEEKKKIEKNSLTSVVFSLSKFLDFTSPCEIP